ncbi:MAG TPA: TIGR04282 family arsenosugar biosynthesis glycosyltransferase [Candidatus Limnocylindria bacterium]
MRRVDRVVVVLAKWPGGGRAKRRLSRDIGAAAATPLARSFLGDTLELTARGGAERVLVAYAPPAARARFARLAPAATLVAQPRGSFGRRLESGLRAGLAVGRHVLLIGADSPTLPPRTLRAGFTRLATADAVLGPAEDGGFYLLGTRVHLPGSLFRRMPWSTPAVAAETLARASAAGIDMALLPRWYDVDNAVSLRRLLGDRAGLARARSTRAALVDLGILR